MRQQGRSAGVVQIREDESISAAARRMSEHKIGALVVTDDQGKIVGILSERDVITRVVAEDGNPAALRAGDCMSSPVISCPHGTPISEARALMSQWQIRHLPVVENGVAVGMISSREIMADQFLRDQKMRTLTIFVMAKLAESRDPETGGHLERVQSYAAALAGQLHHQGYAPQIDADFIHLIYDSSPLHDIGKVGVPDSVLLKPGRLTKEEFEIMKTHCLKGASTIDLALTRFPDAEFLHMGRSIAAWHHERYDGTGYPDGLAGQAIPLAARVFSVCDVYDALVSRRVYKDPMPHGLAVDVMARAAGTQFDPGIVQAFLKCQNAFATIRNRFASAVAAA